MIEQKGPPCGFLGLGSSPRASGSVSLDLWKDTFCVNSINIFDGMKNGGGRDFDLVLKRNADRYEIVDAASDSLLVSRQLTDLHAGYGTG